MKKAKLTERAGKLRRNQKARFVAVGIVNTLIDFTLFNILIKIIGLSVPVSNIMSTSVAMIASYLLNKRAFFNNHETISMRQVVLFFTVTLLGIWLIQTLIVVHVYEWLKQVVDTHVDSSLLSWFLLNVAKASGVVVGAIWNYLWYSRVVFNKSLRVKL